jgi:hypothetical protein
MRPPAPVFPDYPRPAVSPASRRRPPWPLTFHEIVLADGQTAKTNTLRWEDYTQTAVDRWTTARSGMSATV